MTVAVRPDRPTDDAGSAETSREGFVTIDGREMYRLPDFSRLRPFLMTIVSDSDLWMYISSTGGLTAGRRSAERSLFPYETDDALHLRYGVTGPITLMRVRTSHGRSVLWEPFSPLGDEGVTRNLYKSVLSDEVVFEERNESLGLTFTYNWRASAEFGWVRTSTLTTDKNAGNVEVEIFDGLLNLLPAGAGVQVQQQYSCLINAYTQAELDAKSNVATYAITSQIVDRAEAMESLTANVAQCLASRPVVATVSPDGVAAFRANRPLPGESILRGRRAAYLINTTLRLSPDQSEQWRIIIDANRDQHQVAVLRSKSSTTLETSLVADLQKSSDGLQRIVAGADGVQSTADRRTSAHHAVNVLFNNMRGGVFANGYTIRTADFADFVCSRNKTVFAKHKSTLEKIDETIDHAKLLELAQKSSDPNLLRLTFEYLPLTFSRRHGDPSRPWNQFDIHVRDARGAEVLNYQGNWRDIFQNWESMCQSFPTYIESMIAKFVNASTPDGFNPYRISRDGIDWEVPQENNPWSHIGYWGDHQIIYLLKFLEASRAIHPNAIVEMLNRPVFSYVSVPYRIRSYDEILRDPKNTIDFDWDAHRASMKRVAEIGADGRLLADAGGNVVHVTLTEKLLVPLLAKLANFVPGGGIWINTQRPEWNDANNALVGHGVSMVTLYQLRRHVAFCISILEQAGDKSAGVSREVVEWLNATCEIFLKNQNLLKKSDFDDADRRRILDDLGKAFDDYREKIRRSGFTGTTVISYREFREFLQLVQRYLDHTIAANRRSDGLYHAYNLLVLGENSAAVEQLYEMLEGQVAALSSGVLDAKASIDLLKSLFASDMFRADQKSFMLYPERDQHGFMEKNIIPPERASKIPLLKKLIDGSDASVVSRDGDGRIRFNCEFKQATDLAGALDRLSAVDAQDRAAILDLFEDVFEHRRFTGRSGSMFGYEGIGCIYWHMVSKLLLAVQERYFAAVHAGESKAVTSELANYYYRVREGLGFNKLAAAYGAFPIDPYSHTPKHAGAQQPGMTGQVKEEILTRLGELGVCNEEGQICFRPSLLRRSEFSDQGTLEFTICQVPIIYRLNASGPTQITIRKQHDKIELITASCLPKSASESIWRRDESILGIEVDLSESAIFQPENR